LKASISIAIIKLMEESPGNKEQFAIWKDGYKSRNVL